MHWTISGKRLDTSLPTVMAAMTTYTCHFYAVAFSKYSLPFLTASFCTSKSVRCNSSRHSAISPVQEFVGYHTLRSRTTCTFTLTLKEAAIAWNHRGRVTCNHELRSPANATTSCVAQRTNVASSKSIQTVNLSINMDYIVLVYIIIAMRHVSCLDYTSGYFVIYINNIRLYYQHWHLSLKNLMHK